MDDLTADCIKAIPTLAREMLVAILDKMIEAAN